MVTPNNKSITCPKCGFSQPEGIDCGRCGIVFAKYRAPKAMVRIEPDHTPAPRDEALMTVTAETEVELGYFLDGRESLFMEQHIRHFWEVLFGLEQTNEYTLYDSGGSPVGFVVEEAGGFLRTIARLSLGSRRPIDVSVANLRRDVLVTLTRPFSFMFSQMEVKSGGRKLGAVLRRFGIIKRRYDLIDGAGRVFGTIESPIWRLWTFPILDRHGQEQGAITKEWSGLAQEYFTDADNFRIEMGRAPWTVEQRAVILAAAVLVDFDFFEKTGANKR